mmetsp:Transcript_21474/g.36882  ORF Transcript_21474/g.36882 Transcript_21474/m.36882 type:complete len:200 (+) Transcript_21474:911-1510(+)
MMKHRHKHHRHCLCKLKYRRQLLLLQASDILTALSSFIKPGHRHGKHLRSPSKEQLHVDMIMMTQYLEPRHLPFILAEFSIQLEKRRCLPVLKRCKGLQCVVGGVRIHNGGSVAQHPGEGVLQLGIVTAVVPVVFRFGSVPKDGISVQIQILQFVIAGQCIGQCRGTVPVDEVVFQSKRDEIASWIFQQCGQGHAALPP